MTEAAAAYAFLNAPAGMAVRRHALELMRRIDRAHAHWRVSPDQEALHDFRVAVRRLRSWLEAYEEEVPLPSKLYGKLRRLARETNRARDADVALAWLQAHRKQLKTGEHHGWRWVLDRYRQERDDEHARLRATLSKRWERMENRLKSALADPPVAQHERYAERCAARLDVYYETLTGRLNAVRGVEEDEAIHHARIAAKRLRYLLEPVGPALPAARAMIARLMDMQDRLGHMHDMNVLHNRVGETVVEAAASHARTCLRAALAPSGAADLKNLRRRDPLPGLIALACLARREACAGYASYTGDLERSDGEAPFLKREMDPLRAALLGLPVRNDAPRAERSFGTAVTGAK